MYYNKKTYNVFSFIKLKDGSSYSPLFLYILRFYFLFFPNYLLISKFVGTSFWKDALYILCFILGFLIFIKNKFFIQYLVLIFLIVIFQVIQGYKYWEYLTWFFMGLPLFLYFKFINKEQYKKDLWMVIILMLIGVLFVFLYEIPTSNSNFFVDVNAQDTDFTSLRDDNIRSRYYFVSPMAYGQFSWFIAVVVLLNRNFKKYIRYIFALLMFIVIIFSYTRAGLLLGVYSLAILIYIKFGFYKKPINNFLLTLLMSSVLIFQNVVSANKNVDSNESQSDQLRVFFLLDGIDKAQNNFIYGTSGDYFSPRSGNWYDFENSWLSFIVCFGLPGILIIILILYCVFFKKYNKNLLYLAIPWFSYSAVFPIFQEQAAVYISWFIIGAILNSKNWEKLN